MYSHVHGQWIWNKSITAVQRDEGLFLEKEMATHSSVPVWIIPRTEKPGELQAMELQSRTWWLSTRAHTEGSFTSKRYGDNWIPVHEENEPGGHDTKRWGRKFKASLPQLGLAVTCDRWQEHRKPDQTTQIHLRPPLWAYLRIFHWLKLLTWPSPLPTLGGGTAQSCDITHGCRFLKQGWREELGTMHLP